MCSSCCFPVPNLQRVRARVPCRAPMGAEERWLPRLFLALAPALCPHLLLASGSLLGESCGTQTGNARKKLWQAVGSVPRTRSASRAPRPAVQVLSPVLVLQNPWVLGFSFPKTKKLLPLAPWQLPWGRERSKSSSWVPPGLPHGTSPAPPPCTPQLLSHRAPPAAAAAGTPALRNIPEYNSAPESL